MSVTAGELAMLQADAAVWRTETCAVQRPTRVKNADGGYTDAYETVLTVMCRRTPDFIPPVERQAGVVVRGIARWWISFAAETEIRSTDRLVINERTYEVLDDQDRTIEIERRVLAQEMS